jgi:hypothetical protein
MSEQIPGSEGKGRAAASKSGDRATSPSRRRALKAALASAPIIMSIKSRPAFSQTEPGGPTPQQSGTVSSNLSSKPGVAAATKK